MAATVVARIEVAPDHVCVLEYDILRMWSVCPGCGHIATDEQLYYAVRASEQRELTR